MRICKCKCKCECECECRCKIKIFNCIYKKDNILPCKISNVNDFLKILENSKYSDNTDIKDNLYFRGENANYCYRTPTLYRNEDLVFEGSEYYYRVLLNELGEDDYQENSSLVRLMSKLQHHGAATRMLDVTTNPLIALYFAVQSYDENDDGYVYIYSSNSNQKGEKCKKKNESIDTSDKENEEKTNKEKFDTGHTIAIKSACNFIDQQKLNDFLYTMKNLNEKFDESKYLIDQSENTNKNFYKDLTLDELTNTKIYKCFFNPDQKDNVTEFMELLNQRAKTKERLVFPFKIYDDLTKAHIVLPAKSTDRIRQ